jgi:hypothetical protein
MKQMPPVVEMKISMEDLMEWALGATHTRWSRRMRISLIQIVRALPGPDGAQHRLCVLLRLASSKWRLVTCDHGWKTKLYNIFKMVYS